MRKSTEIEAQAAFEKAIAIARTEIWQGITSGKAGSGSIAIMDGGKIVYMDQNAPQLQHVLFSQ
jgi:hypothetical protein